LASETPSESAELDWRIVAVFVVATVCLALRVPFETGQIPVPWRSYHFNPALILGYGAIPFAAATVLGFRPYRYFRLRRLGKAAPFVLGVTLVSIFCAFIGSRLQSFRAFYGDWPRDSVAQYVIGGVLDVFGDEFFFRGFLIYPLAKKFGWYAILISTMTYTLAHAGRPMVELFWALPYGLALSYVAFRTETVVYTAAMHFIFGASLTALTR
jgi:uncharacterized protein